MIFCLNGEVDNFEEKLSPGEEARKVTGLAENFSYVSTTECDYSITQVSKLSLLDCYNLAEGLKNVNFDINEIK
jgi:hypothetical protein